MVCKICGANNSEGIQFCNDCGAPLIAYNQTQPQVQQVNPQINQALQMQMAQKQQLEQQRLMQQQKAQQMQQQLQQQQQQRQQQYGQQQPMQGQQQYNQQQQQQNQLQYNAAQNAAQQQYYKQLYEQQQAQQQYNQQQPVQAQQQYNQQQPVQAQQQYNQQQPVQAQQQGGANIKNGKSSKGLIIGLVAFVIIAALAAVFIIFVLPKLSKGEPKGEYANSDFGGYILFDDGVYAVYGTGGGYEFGTYEVKGDKITFKSANGETDYGKYDKKADTVEYGYLFESNDSKETFDVDIDKSYVNGLNNKIKEAADDACGLDEIITEAETLGSSYYIYGSELSDGHTALSRALANNLGYSNDNVLSYLLENNYITFEISVNTSSRTVTVTIY